MKKIVIAGGTGFLGTSLINHYHLTDAEIVVLTRGKSRNSGKLRYVNWDAESVGAWASELENTDVLINLNGKSVDCRYTEANKKLIYATRIDSTLALGNAVLACKNPPKLWINSASATIYRHSLDKEMDEISGEYGTGFSVDVCHKWEAAFNRFQLPDTRKVIIRTGIVLGKHDGPMIPLLRLAKLGMGGKQGMGNQYFSWLHEIDFVQIIDFITSHKSISGAINVTGPNPVPNSYFMKTLRKSVGIGFGIPMPVWLLEFGAILIDTETELILKSRRVIPDRLLQEGYTFSYDTIEKALADLCKN